MAITHDVIGTLQTAGFTTSFTYTFGTNPTAGKKVLLYITCHSALTLSDNASNVWTQDVIQSGIAGATNVQIWRCDGVKLPATGSLVVTIGVGGGGNSISAIGISYSGVKSGGPTAVNRGTGTSNAVTTNGAEPASSGALAAAIMADQSSANPETIGSAGGGFTNQATYTTGGGALNCTAMADQIATGGPAPMATTWTLGDSPLWVSAIAVYDAQPPLYNGAEGGINGSVVSTANSGGLSGNAFDQVDDTNSATLVFDSSLSAHGAMSYKFATGATAGLTRLMWNTSMGTRTQVWFRFYLYITAYPSVTMRLWDADQGSTACATLVMLSTGVLQFRTSSAGTQQTATNTAAVPLGQWVRVEGYVIGNATTGAVQLTLFDSADSTTATSGPFTVTSINTTGPMDHYSYGISTTSGSGSGGGSNLGPFWMDGLALSNIGAIGPVVAISAGAALQDGVVGRQYLGSLTASGGTAPYTFLLQSGSLPPGLYLNPNGSITGIPTAAGSWTFTVQVTDFVGAQATETITLPVITVIEGSIYGQFDYGQMKYGQQAFIEPSIPVLVKPGVSPTPIRAIAGTQALWVAEPFVAQSLNYESVGVSWKKPLGTPARWRLIRNRYGYPADQNDGDLLIDQPDWPGTFYLDQAVIPGRYVYYGLYAQTDSTNDIWQRVAVTGCLVIENSGKASWLQSRLPAYFTQYLDGSLTQDATGNQYLEQFLQVLGWGLDYVQTQYDMLFGHLNDPMAMPIDDLVNLATQLGLPFDPMISVYLMRKAAANWAHVAEERGTPLGLTNQLELLTGFGVDLQVGPNLMLDNDQSYFPDPSYPSWNQYTAYKVGEIVSYNWWLYSCAVAGPAGTAPTGTYLSNTNWSAISDWADPQDTLRNLNTGGIGTFEAIYPTQTGGVINVVRGHASTINEASDGGAFTWASNPTAGQKVLFVLWTTSTETINSVVDNGVTPRTFTQDLHYTDPTSTKQIAIYHADNITLPASGSYTVTVNGSGGHNVGAAGVAYTGLQPGSPYSQATTTGNTNNNPPEIIGNNPPINGGAVIGVFSDDDSNNTAITLHAPSLNDLGNRPDGTTYTRGAAADGIIPAGGSVPNASGTNPWYWTLQDFAHWVSASAVYPAAQQYTLTEDIGDRDPLGSGNRNVNALAVNNQMPTTQDVAVRSISRTLAEKAASTAQIPYGLALSGWNTDTAGAQVETTNPGFPASPSTNYSGGFYIWANQPWPAGCQIGLKFANGTTWLATTYSTAVPLTTTPQIFWISNATAPASTTNAGMVVNVVNGSHYPSNLVVYVQQCPAQTGSNPITNMPGQYSWYQDNPPYPTMTHGAWQVPSIYVPDNLQVINDGVPVPFTRPSQQWSSTVRYDTGDVVTYQYQPFVALRASTGATPPIGRTASPEWAPLSTDPRLRLMVSAGISGNIGTAVKPFVEWYDIWGQLISRVYARTPTAGTPGIPDSLAFDGFLLNPGAGITSRATDNAFNIGGTSYKWFPQANDWTVSPTNGGMAFPNSGIRSEALIACPADGQVAVTLVNLPPVAGARAAGIVFRWSDDNNYWAVAAFGAGDMNLYKVVAGAGTVVNGIANGSVNPGDRITVQCSGSSIAVLLNGTLVLSTTDSFNATAGNHAGMIVE